MSWSRELSGVPAGTSSRRWTLTASLAVAGLLAAGCSPASREARFMKRGKAYLEKKDYARAVLEFRNAEKVMPNDAEPYFQEGIAFIGLDNYRLALRSLTRATQLDPKNVAAQVKLTQLLSSSQNEPSLHRAEEQGKTALSLSPDNPDTLDALALTELKLGNADDAARYLEQVLGKFPQRLRSSITLAVVKLSHHDVAGAEQILKKAVSEAPQSAEPLVALGELYLVLRKTGDAEASLRRALDLDPRNATALQQLAGIEAAAGRSDQAEELYRRLTALGDKRFRSVHARYLLQTGKTDAGIAELQKLYRQDPADRDTRTRLVAAYARQNRLPDARGVLEAVLKVNRQDVEARLQKAEIELLGGNWTDAQNDLSDVLHFRPDSAQAHFLLSRVRLAQGDPLNRRHELALALSLNPKLVRVRIELARALTLAGTPSAAVDLLDQTPDDQKQTLPVIEERNWALLGSRNYPELHKGIENGMALRRTRDLLVQDAMLKIVNRDWSRARSSLEEVLKKAPSDLQALDLLAQTYADQKQPKLAIQKIRYYAARNPQSADVRLLLGRLLLAEGKADEARAAIVSAQAADAKNAAAGLALAQLDRAAGRSDAARRTLSALLASKDLDRDSQIAAHMQMGSLEDAAGNREAELEHWQKVVDLDRSNVFALNNLAYVLLNYTKRPDEALKYALRAHQLAPENPDIEDTLGWVLYLKGVYPTALQHLEHAVSQDGNGTGPNFTVRKYHLAMACFKNGDRTRGLRMFESAHKLDPDTPEARMAEALKDTSKQP
jgi:tetratricopeptide (TPR) repeat protein